MHVQSLFTRHKFKLIACVAQIAVFACCGLTAFLLRFDLTLPWSVIYHLQLGLVVWMAVKTLTFALLGLENGYWQFTSVGDVFRIAVANVIASAASTAVILMVGRPGFPRSIYFLDFALCLLATIGIRTAARMIAEAAHMHRRSGGQRVVIYGAGVAGISLVREINLNASLGYSVCGFVDDDRGKEGSIVHGVRVLGPGSKLPLIVQNYRIDQVLIAVPSAHGSDLIAILRHCRAAGVRFRTIPGMSELIRDRGLASQIREVGVEDLLGRPPVRLDEQQIRARLEEKSVLITGAAGSIGSEICRQVAVFHPAAIIGFDISETALFYLEQEAHDKFPGVRFVPEIGSIQNRRRLAEVFRRHRPSLVYHAAAYKHVPLMEDHVFEAVENNVLGTHKVALTAAEYGVAGFVMISSDKAVRPANIMGVTKRIAELIVKSMQNGGGKFVSVRFGNVLGSEGSVVPLFKMQIAAGGPVKVTHPDMKRYFMTIPEAAQLVLQASTMGSGGEVFILEMGSPVRIVDLATNLILLSGLRPGEDIQIEFTGTRPGEKLYEELAGLEEETRPTCHEKVRTIIGNGSPVDSIERHVCTLADLCRTRDERRLILELKELVPDFSPSAHILRRVIGDDVQPAPSGQVAAMAAAAE